ncbi:MAG TPA: hypothetical protein VMN36_09305 [Verrucomicrobiales bacterium]|nr:hypothetical protein [Verrucomicrobiales bacterium]
MWLESRLRQSLLADGRRMIYGHFRSQGYFIGSGVVEARCKHVIGQRMKQSGMFWGEKGAENLKTY